MALNNERTMFTGLVEGLGEIHQIVNEAHGRRFVVDSKNLFLSEAAPKTTAEITIDQVIPLGASIAINGCCLTVVAISSEGFLEFQAGTETLSKTNLGELESGSPVNLERSLTPQSRLGGHLVQGHVDATGTIVEILPEGEWKTIWFEAPESLMPELVPKGSITVDGISLTVVECQTKRFSVALIPHTLEMTTLGRKSIGDSVNLETDILGKYVVQTMTRYLPHLQSLANKNDS